jgi:hypothetical protein
LLQLISSTLVALLLLLLVIDTFLQLLDLIILPVVLFILFALFADSLVETDAGGKGADDCRDKGSDDERFLVVVS